MLSRIVIWACAALLVPAGCANAGSARPVPASVPAEAQTATIESVVDGDTVWVVAESAGPLSERDRHKVRLLEIDAPEFDGPNGRPECGARASDEFLRSRLPEGSTVYLVSDSEDRDRYGRPLRYVWDARGRFINELVAEKGHARALLIHPNDRFIHMIRQAESEARVSGAGLWERC